MKNNFFQAERVMKTVDLEEQKNTFAKKLSGGQKRKLSVGIAIIGDPKVKLCFLCYISFHT